MYIVLKDCRFVHGWEIPIHAISYNFPKQIPPYIPSRENVQQTRLPTSSVSAIQLCQSWVPSSQVDLGLNITRSCDTTSHRAFFGGKELAKAMG